MAVAVHPVDNHYKRHASEHLMHHARLTYVHEDYSMKFRQIVLVLTVALCGYTGAAEAQYFGRNKVQYEQFDFKVKSTEHFDIYFYPEEQPAVELAARMAERWYSRLSTLLRHELSG